MSHLKKTPLNIALLYGGTSPEREFTYESVESIFNALIKTSHNVFIFYIAKDGQWIFTKNIHATSYFDDTIKTSRKYVKSPIPEIIKYFNKYKINLVFPILHGWLGEDGRVQSLCDWLNIPCVGAGALTSALTLDKILLKNIIVANELPTIDYLNFSIENFYLTKEKFIAKIGKNIGYPCILKPVHGGSSIGLSLVTNCGQIEDAIFKIGQSSYESVLVEKYVKSKDIEVGVIGNKIIKIGAPVEMTYDSEIYDFESKCTSDDKVVPASLPKNVIKEIKQLTHKIYNIIECRGFARIDFLIDCSNMEIFINEINTVPYIRPDSSFILSLKESFNYSFEEVLNTMISLSLEMPNLTQLAYGRNRINRNY